MLHPAFLALSVLQVVLGQDDMTCVWSMPWGAQVTEPRCRLVDESGVDVDVSGAWWATTPNE